MFKRQFKLKWLFIILLVFYFLYLSFSFFYQKSENRFSSVCFREPLIYDDYAMHYADSIKGSEIFKDTGNFWRYDTSFFAGYPTGVFLAIDNHWALLFQVIFGFFLPAPFVFNLAVFSAFVLLPILIWLAAKNFRLPKKSQLLVMVMSTFLLIEQDLSNVGGYNEQAGFRNFMLFGGYGFLLGQFLAIYLISLIFSLIKKKVHKGFLYKEVLFLSFWASLTFFIHPLTAVISIVFGLPLILIYWKKLIWKKYLVIFIAIIVSLTLNSVWWLPYFSFSNLKSDWDQYLQTRSGLFLDYLSDNSGVTMIIFFIFYLFIYEIYRQGLLCSKIRSKIPSLKKYDKFFLVSILLLGVISFWGSQIGLGFMQPMRFVMTFSLVAILFISSKYKILIIGSRRIISIICLLFFLSGLIRPPITMQCGIQDKVDDWGTYHNNEKNSESIEAFLEKKSYDDGRLLIQDSAGHPYFDTHYSAILSLETEMEIISGPFPFVPTKYSFTQFVDDRIFNKNIETISDSEIRDYFDLYNITYVLVFSDNAKDYFQDNSSFRLAMSIEGFYIYEYLMSERSFCYNCKAEITTNEGRIYIKNADRENFVLKYHYLKSLDLQQTEGVLKKIYLEDDPVPFIKVEGLNDGNGVVEF